MQQLSEKAVATLPVPDSGNKVHWFSGATLQGKKAPAGFGVRVTAGVPSPSYFSTGWTAASISRR
jgi:hypothetical protein